MSEFDAELVAPNRLKLATLLSSVTEAEFSTLQEALGVSDSVLSKHLSALEGAGYLSRRKGVLEGRRTTWVALTRAGRAALAAHVAALRALIDTVERDAPLT